MEIAVALFMAGALDSLIRCPGSLPAGVIREQRRRQRERQKAIGLHLQNNNAASTSRFLVHFFAVVVRLRRKTGY